ncbi:hypothetical protein PENTCL1PPCAC_23618, partial [Pristionchus entomophagus]
MYLLAQTRSLPLQRFDEILRTVMRIISVIKTSLRRYPSSRSRLNRFYVCDCNECVVHVEVTSSLPPLQLIFSQFNRSWWNELRLEQERKLLSHRFLQFLLLLIFDVNDLITVRMIVFEYGNNSVCLLGNFSDDHTV